MQRMHTLRLNDLMKSHRKGILYAMEDEQVDAAILDITKATEVSDIATMPLSDKRLHFLCIARR